MKFGLYTAVGCALGLVISCSDSDSGAPPTTDATEIGMNGGVVTADAASVDVPKGALSSAVKITVAESSVDVAAPAGYVLAGPLIAFTPHGQSFEVPVTLTLPYSSSSSALSVLRLEDEDDTSWEVMAGGEFAKGKATLEVTAFSIYAVAAEGESDGSGGAGGMSSSASGGSPETTGGADTAAGGAPTGSGDLIWSCDRSDTDGNGLRICTDYFYPKKIVDLVGDKLMPGCPGAGNGVLGVACDTTDAVVGCLTHDVDGIAGVTVTNWFYAGTKADISDGVLCQEENTEIVDPP